MEIPDAEGAGRGEEIRRLKRRWSVRISKAAQYRDDENRLSGSSRRRRQRGGRAGLYQALVTGRILRT